MRGGYKVTDTLSLLFFLSLCSAKQIYGEALNAVPRLQYNTLSMEYPADDSHSNSPAGHDGMQCRKLLRGMMGRRTLAEEKSSTAESIRSGHSRWIARTLHHLHQAADHIAHGAPHSQGIVAAANHEQLSGASSNHKTGKYYEWKSLDGKHRNTVSRHSKRSHDGDDDEGDEISYDQGSNFHVDYNGPKTHLPKHH